MATNAQTALTNRQYYAIHGNFGIAPDWFQHAPPAGKPLFQQRTVALDASEQARIGDMLQRRENGTISTKDFGGLSDDALSVLNDLETHFERPDVQQWINKNKVSREAQWKLFNADVHNEAEIATLAGTLIYPSNNPNGIGSNPTSSGTPVSV